MTEFSIRLMEKEDIDKVHVIDKVCFTSPWSLDIYMREITENKYAHYFVVTDEKVIIGYVGLWIVADDAQVTNIALLPEYRGYGIGEKVFGYAMSYCISKGANQLSLEVRISNVVAQNLYKKFGLAKGGIRKNYYPDNGEDAYVMWVKLT